MPSGKKSTDCKTIPSRASNLGMRLSLMSNHTPTSLRLRHSASTSSPVGATDAHWARFRNGSPGARPVATQACGSSQVLPLPADVNEVTDPDHGPRAAVFALEQRGLCSTCLTMSSALASCLCRAHWSGLIPTSRSRPAGMPIDSISVGLAASEPALQERGEGAPTYSNWADARRPSASSRSS